MAEREDVEVFGLAFLDVISCGLGGVIILMLIFSTLAESGGERKREVQATTAAQEKGIDVPPFAVVHLDLLQGGAGTGRGFDVVATPPDVFKLRASRLFEGVPGHNHDDGARVTRRVAVAQDLAGAPDSVRLQLSPQDDAPPSQDNAPSSSFLLLVRHVESQHPQSNLYKELMSFFKRPSDTDALRRVEEAERSLSHVEAVGWARGLRVDPKDLVGVYRFEARLYSATRRDVLTGWRERSASLSVVGLNDRPELMAPP